MNFKPFYVSTEGITAKQAQDLFNLAVKNGAEGECYIKNGGTPSYSGQEWTLSDWNFIGVCSEGGTEIHSLVIVFGEEAVELTYEEALLHVQGITPTGETKPKLKVTKERPTSGQFIATWICNGEPWSFTFKWVNNTLYTVDERAFNYWSESRETFDFETEVWYTIIK